MIKSLTIPKIKESTIQVDPMVGMQSSAIDADEYTVHREEMISIIGQMDLEERNVRGFQWEQEFQEKCVLQLARKLIENGAVTFDYEYDALRNENVAACTVWYMKRKDDK